ncbi:MULTISPECIES: TrbI/VirB10 family protein [unclassified Fusobacterium]|uniref:TrbI/VirB10 family protein n=1 Tax=unclassified Fusobacterium TaxID=2648384 RepID=UPI001B8B6818|nr:MULTISPECIES: TrbI/VirB10 family protein [unclassified Fusobacterium]MBR8700489.1 hypothetical protein [Fusobacterium sp. DD45]MBR8710246.1 hypothetical protein [Fusobacterium sp. DD28]MBR8750768.1 hypothetical protein [Fusobacterium sp. DD26]
MLDIKKSANNNIEQGRRLNVKNIVKFVGGLLIAIIALSLFVGNIFSSKDKKDTEITKSVNDDYVKDDSSNSLSTSYSGQNREKITYETKQDIQEEEPIKEEIQYNEPAVQETNPIDEFIKEQELQKVQRYYQAKTSPFKTASPKMNNATTGSSTSTTYTSELGGGINNYDYITAGLDNANPNLQKEKKQWLKQAAIRNFVNREPLVPAISRYEVKAGTYIPIVMTFELISDLPGKVTAMVRENIYDSLTGNYIVIPMGSKLFGQYNSEISWGQERVQVVFNRLTLPNGKSIDLKTMIGASELGQSGMTGKVDMQLGKVIGSVIMAGVVGGANGALTNNGNHDKDKNAALSSAGEESGNQMLSIVDNYTNKVLNVQPRITVPFGKRGTLILTEDLLLEKYDNQINYLNE